MDENATGNKDQLEPSFDHAWASSVPLFLVDAKVHIYFAHHVLRWNGRVSNGFRSFQHYKAPV